MMRHTDKIGLIAVGDAMLDIVAEPDAGFSDLEYMEVSMSFQAGGSGVNLALAAADMGFAPVSLVCSLGADEEIANRTIRNELQAAGVSLIANPVQGCYTGTTIISYLASGSRILMTAPGANRVPLTNAVVDATCEVLPSVLVISGYMLSRPSTRNGVLEIMRRAARRDTVIALDLVPHSLHTKITPAEIRLFLKFVNFVAGGFGTFAGLGMSIDAVLTDVEGVLAYERDGTYRFVRRGRSEIEGEFPYHGAMAGASERLLIWILQKYFLAE